MSASTQTSKRRKQHARAHVRGSRKPAGGRAAERRKARGRRAQAGNVRRDAKPAIASSETPAPSIMERVAGIPRRVASLLRRSGEAETQARSCGPDTPIKKVWPRRLAIASLKLGAVVAVAWGLLLAGREVYEYSTTSARFEVQHLVYEPSAHLDDDTLRGLLAIEPGTNILACDLEQLSERIAEHPWVALATVTRNLPDTLEVEVIEHEPAALVLAGRFYLVNEEGLPFKVVERGERGELPIITGVDKQALATAGGKPVPELVEALKLVRSYQSKQRPRLGELHVGEDGSVTLYTAESGTALALGREEFEARLGRWDALRAALGERADRLAVVHLDHESKPDRRDRVVARFASEEDEVVLLAAAASNKAHGPQSHEPAKQDPKPARLPARRAGKRNRIPSYE